MNAGLAARDTLAHPEWLLPLAAVLALCAAGLLAARVRARRRRRVLFGTGVEGIGAGGVRDAACGLAALALCAALLAPVVGTRRVTLPASGVDVAIAVDVSRSMNARDVAPSRLDRARRTAAALLERLQPGDRAALAAFAGRGALLTPLTSDLAVLGELLPALDSELVRPRGSHLGAGVEAAIGAFEAGSARPRVVLLLTDGETSAPGPAPGRDAALRAEARVLAVAIGGEAGATIPDRGVPLRDDRGRTVVTRLRLENLTALAEASGGVLLRADRWGEVDVARLVDLARRDAGRARGEPVVRETRAPRVLPFAALAFVLLLLETARGGGRPRAPRWSTVPRHGARAAAPLAALAGLVLLGASAPDGAVPGAHALVQRGLALARDGRVEAAARSFEAAAVRARSPRTAALAYYDLGVLALEAGSLERARDAFLDALALAPDDGEARFNLEWTLRALAAEEPPEPDDDAARDDPEARDPSPTGASQEAPPDREGREPAASRDEARAPRREPSGTRGEPRPTPPELTPELTPAETARWLSQVQDDPRRALQEAARAGEPERPRARPAAPAW